MVRQTGVSETRTSLKIWHIFSPKKAFLLLIVIYAGGCGAVNNLNERDSVQYHFVPHTLWVEAKTLIL